jgi:hypothetical protein
MIHGERTTGHGEPGDLQSFGLDRVRALARLGLGARDRVELLQRARDKTANRVLRASSCGSLAATHLCNDAVQQTRTWRLVPGKALFRTAQPRKLCVEDSDGFGGGFARRRP